MHPISNPQLFAISLHAQGNSITCDLAKFSYLSESDQYVLVHHEFAGLAGVELPNGDDSNYGISNQISEYLVDQTVKKLTILKQPEDNEAAVDPRNVDCVEKYSRVTCIDATVMGEPAAADCAIDVSFRMHSGEIKTSRFTERAIENGGRSAWLDLLTYPIYVLQEKSREAKIDQEALANLYKSLPLKSEDWETFGIKACDVFYDHSNEVEWLGN